MTCVTLWNTVYIDAVLAQLRADGHTVLDDDVARLSPFQYKHINVYGSYHFSPASRTDDTPSTMRPLRVA